MKNRKTVVHLVESNKVLNLRVVGAIIAEKIKTKGVLVSMKNTLEKNVRVTQEELLLELKAMMKDCFVGTITVENNELLFSLVNKQRFSIKVEEV